MKNEVTEHDLRLINCYEHEKLTANDVYVFNMRLCDNQVDRDNECFTVDSLYTLKNMFVGKMGIIDHCPDARNLKARILACQVEQVSKTAVGGFYYRLIARAYIRRKEESESLIASIESGDMHEISIGCSISKILCSICGEDIQVCPHEKGAYYNGQLCCGELINPIDAYEWSFVTKPTKQMTMPNEMTYEAAMIELNHLKSSERMEIDRERLNAAIDKLGEAARYRIPQKPTRVSRCPCCDNKVCELSDEYCPACGQALDWSAE